MYKSFFFTTLIDAENEANQLQALGWKEIAISGDHMHGWIVSARKPQPINIQKGKYDGKAKSN